MASASTRTIPLGRHERARTCTQSMTKRPMSAMKKEKTITP
jgi:hypothetical protein